MFLPILPLIISMSFFLIADIDSPRGGVSVCTHNLIAQYQSANRSVPVVDVKVSNAISAVGTWRRCVPGRFGP
jgi:hypothetical protein